MPCYIITCCHFHKSTLNANFHQETTHPPPCGYVPCEVQNYLDLKKNLHKSYIHDKHFHELPCGFLDGLLL